MEKVIHCVGIGYTFIYPKRIPQFTKYIHVYIDKESLSSRFHRTYEPEAISQTSQSFVIVSLLANLQSQVMALLGTRCRSFVFLRQP